MSTDGSALGYPELLRLATSKGLTELDSTIVQIPSEANGGHGVVLAAARTGTALFRALGEAWRDSLPAPQQAQTLTVAEVRAKTRALCEAVGMPQPLADAGKVAQPLTDGVATRVIPERPATPPPSALERPAAPVVPQLPERPAASQDAPPARPVPAVAVAASGRSARTDAEPPRPLIGQGVAATAPTGPAAPAQDLDPRSAVSAGPTPSRPAPAPIRPGGDGAAPDEDPAAVAPGRERTLSPRPVRPASPSPLGNEGIGPEITSKLLQMTRRIAELKAEEMNEEGALERLDSFFVRRFGHGIDQATRMEGQGVVQRLAAEVARLTHAPAEGTI